MRTTVGENDQARGNVPRVFVPFQFPTRYMGDTDGIKDGIILNPLILAKSILNMGELTKKTHDTIKNNQCLKIVAFGGSITVGGSPADDVGPGCNYTCVPASWKFDRPKGVQDAWPKHLSTLLNNYGPCVGGQHTVENLGVSGQAIDYWVEQLTRVAGDESNLHNSVFSADIVIVESSVNDVGLDTTRISKDAELLILVLLKRNISVIFTGSSSRKLWNESSPRSEQSDTVSSHLSVAKHHRVPLISPVDALGPFLTEEAATFFIEIFRVDYCCHISVTAHRIIAHFIFHFLQLQYWGLTLQIYKGVTVAANVASARPLYNSRGDILQFSRPSDVGPFFIDAFFFNTSVTTSGWVAGEDVKGKPGLLAYNTSERVGYIISASTVKKHVLEKEVHFLFLHSYEHMGSARVEIVQGKRIDASDDCTIVQNASVTVPSPVVGMATVDCLWETHVSEAVVTEVPFSFIDDDNNTCLVVSVETIESTPPRGENKIKLISFTIY